MEQPTLDQLHDEATWVAWRDRIPAALDLSGLATTEQSRAEFIAGARLLRLESRPRIDGQRGATPVQLAIADMLATGQKLNAVLEPRRTTKTTSIQAVMLGRCELREDYTAGWTLATTGLKASERFKRDIVAHLFRLYPDPKHRPFDVNLGKGYEHIAWPNGSYLGVYAPGGEGFRSGGFDFTWVDEGGEADPDLSQDLLVAILPTMDTKPGAQFIVSGTAAKYRDGNLLWDMLERDGAGVIRHAIPDTTDPEELEAWEPDEDHPRARVRQLIELSHPGVGYTTPLDAIAENFNSFPREKFAQEYLGLFGTEGASVGLIPAAHLERAAQDVDMPTVPPRFTLAVAIHPDGLWSSVGVAWQYEEAEDLVTVANKLDGASDDRPPRNAIGLLWHQQGVQGLATKLLTFARKYRVPVIYDQLSQAAGVEIETLSRATPRPTLTPATTVDVRRAATKTMKAFEAGTLVYFRKQAQLQHAMEIAVKRQIGTAGGFGFGRPRNDYTADITPIEACALALHFLDDTPNLTTKPADALHF